MDDIVATAARLRQAAEAKPLRLPVNRRVDETHHAVSEDGLGVWFTIQISPHTRVEEAVFERSDRPPSDEECTAWLAHLIPGGRAQEAQGLPGAHSRRFEAFERAPGAEAPIA